MVNPLSSLSFQPVLNNCWNKGRGVYYPICGMVCIKYRLLLIGKSSPWSGSSGFILSLSEMSICETPHNRKQIGLSASLKIKHILPSCFLSFPFKAIRLFILWSTFTTANTVPMYLTLNDVWLLRWSLETDGNLPHKMYAHMFIWPERHFRIKDKIQYDFHI